jgi:hypothetical protein
MKRTRFTAPVVLVAALAAVASTAACSNISGKSWAITYEVTGSTDGTLAQATYANSPDRYQDKTEQDSAPAPVGVPWKQPVIISAGQTADVTAHPTGNLTLSCRILLDGTKVLAKATAPAAGAPVTCSVVTGS